MKQNTQNNCTAYTKKYCPICFEDSCKGECKIKMSQKPCLTVDGRYAVYIHTDGNDIPLHITFSEQEADLIGCPYQVQYIKVDKYKTKSDL